MIAAAGFTVTPHPHHARLRRVAIEADAIRAFFGRVRHVDVQNLEYVPFMRFVMARELDAAVGGGLVTTIRGILTDRATGGFTTGVAGATDDTDLFVKFGTAVAHLAGLANDDAMTKKYYARFSVAHTDASDSYLRQAYRDMMLHTDGTYVAERTDWLLMMKFAEAYARGGETRLLHLDDWSELARFAEDPIGTRPMAYKSPPSKNVPIVVEHPTFFRENGSWCMSYIDQFAYPATIEEGVYLAAMERSMETSPATIALPLPVGDLVMLDNSFWVHGRAAFEPDERLHRELMRLRGVYAPR
jgi:protein CsiD